MPLNSSNIVDSRQSPRNQPTTTMTQNPISDLDLTMKVIIAMILTCIFLTFYANTFYPRYLARVPRVGRGEKARKFAADNHKRGEQARLNEES
ncbi:hypothetical protein ABVK25_008321 [Lepraria finkii]|uniref:Transmembrane protein n=1 Tax=Lepraria finkii TaxID=1340010 RepID=A0ABR4B3L3_9LECA